MNISDFRVPTEHPYNMLEGYQAAFEKEGVLAWILRACIESDCFQAVETKHSHPTMVEDGLLEKVAPKKYLLTEKAKGLLYSVYHA